MSSFKNIYVNDMRYPLINGLGGQSISTDGSNYLIFNYPTAQKLKSLTGDVSVNTNDPIAGQILTATSATTAIWQTRIFGSNYQYVEDLTESQTTSTNWADKLVLTTPTIPIGKYKISWIYDWNYNATNRFFRGRIRQDNSTLALHRQRPRSTSANQIYNNMGFMVVDITVSDAYNFSIQYRSSNVLDTATISDARIEIFRVE